MPGLGQGRGEIGETVASFATYEGAQKAVSSLVAADIPAREIAIVGNGLRSVERVTGKLGYATAARQGAINGLLLGLFFSAIFVLGNSAVGVPVFIGVLFVGVALGMLLSIAGYAIIRRRRDFASVTQVIAEHYEVTVLPTSIHRAREVLGPTTTVARPPALPRSSGQPPAFGERSDAPPRYGVRTDEPPKYGERADDPPQYGERADDRHRYGEPSDEPPRYGQRIPAASENPRPAASAADGGASAESAADEGSPAESAPDESVFGDNDSDRSASDETSTPEQADAQHQAEGDRAGDDDRA